MRSTPSPTKKHMYNNPLQLLRVALSAVTAGIAVSCLIALPYGVLLAPLAASIRYAYLFFSALRNPLQKTIIESSSLSTPNESLHGKPWRMLIRGAETLFRFFKHLNQDPVALMLLAATLAYVFVNPLSMLFFSQQASVLGLINSCVEVMLFMLLSVTRFFEVSQSLSRKSSTGSFIESLQAISATILLMVWLVHDEFLPVAPVFLRPLLYFFSTGAAQALVSGVCVWNALQWISEQCFAPPVPMEAPVNASGKMAARGDVAVGSAHLEPQVGLKSAFPDHATDASTGAMYRRRGLEAGRK